MIATADGQANFNSTKVRLKPIEKLCTTHNKHYRFCYAKIYKNGQKYVDVEKNVLSKASTTSLRQSTHAIINTRFQQDISIIA